jgi:hypothetical protein
MYGGGVMNEGNVRKWCCLFNVGTTGVHYEARYGCPSIITDDLKDRSDAQVRENRRFTINKLHKIFT